MNLRVSLSIARDFEMKSIITLLVVLTILGIQTISFAEDYIAGPWLWMIASGSNIHSDQLSTASSGNITEEYIATHGVSEGDPVGSLQWTQGKVLPTKVCKTRQVLFFTTRTCSANNINELVNDIGLSENRDLNHYSAYALINIISPRDQENVMMGVGSDDSVKVWLNGEVVHTNDLAGTGARIRIGSGVINGQVVQNVDQVVGGGRSTSGIQDTFSTRLKSGNNLLLVKVSDFTGHWGMFFTIFDTDFTTATPLSDTPAVVSLDVNGDGTVNIQDLVLIASSLGQTGENPVDVNGDGVVNIQDLVLVAGNLGEAAAAPAAWRDTLNGTLTRADVQHWLAEARQLAATDPAAQRGVLFLETLLLAFTPQETALLANYPNPFNPETWIPYQLAKAADVNVAIYAADGTLIRTLSLGYQSAGTYQSRSRAAYWDGRNAHGETVASGVYFYQLETDAISSLRKMVILK